jgi:hypothetical protein
MNKFRIFSFLMVSVLAFPAFGIVGSLNFTAAEKADHAAKADVIAQAAAQCLHDHWNDHVQFYTNHTSGKKHLSRYFGNRKWIKGEKNSVRYDINGKPVATLYAIRPALRAAGFDPELEKQMVSMSCIDLSRACLGSAFDKYGQGSYWDRIDAFSVANHTIGTVIQVGLQALGWKMLYWNPDPSQNKDFDAFDQRAITEGKMGKVIQGYHAYTYSTVQKRNVYYKDSTGYEYKVDDKTTLVGFGQNPPATFKKIPFAVGTANIGYHVFLATEGDVIEAHSVRDIFSFDNLEFNPFNPLAGGAPLQTKWEHYRSGIIVVPPGYL